MEHVYSRDSYPLHQEDISNISKKELPYLRRKIGIIFQDFQEVKEAVITVP